jgi:conjugative relaxase-like TrwC/TraI family protein
MRSMLRIIQNQSSAGAKNYYSHSDYLSEGQELAGLWHGKGAELLGLAGVVEKKDFDSLCDNLDPRTGKQLTPRNKSDRTVGYDFNFNVPKGLSLAYALGGDDRILGAVRKAAAETMEEIEKDTKTRVRKLGKQEERETGNLVIASYLHTTARPVEGVPDPNIHIHAFTFNATFDSVEQRWKAAQFRDQKRDAGYFEAVFHSKLSKHAKDLGYGIERKGKFWDVTSVPKSIRDKFQRRTDQIEELARKKAKKKGALDADTKGELGAKSREAKAKMTWPELQQAWRSRLTADEAASPVICPIPNSQGPAIETTPAQAMMHAVEHCFEREAVVPERTMLASALRRGFGDVTIERIERELEPHKVLRRELFGRKYVTTNEVLKEEEAVLAFAREGRGAVEPLQLNWQCSRDWLSDEQKEAISQLVESKDRVQILRGGAGTGKTTLMQEAVAAIESSGRKVFTFAPSAEASRKVLRDEGFATATTVAELLVNQRLQRDVAGSVIWIDEASLLSTKDLRKVFDLAAGKNARVILSGDYRQHGSVHRGGILRILETYAGLRPAHVHTIQRQKGEYKKAVAAFADGRLEEGFDRLDALKWIKEIPDQEKRDATIARDYVHAMVEAGSDKDKALVIAPTHREAQHLTEAIREQLQAAGILSSGSISVMRLIPRHLTEAEQADSACYEPGDVIVFHQHARGHRKGERIVLGDTLPASLAKVASRFSVYRPATLDVAVGEQIRFTAGGSTSDGKHRINNGSIARVSGFDASGDMILDNGWRVRQDFGHLSHGYVQTSVAAQGRTVQRVFIAESAESFGAASNQQWYVSISRGKQEARIYTHSKDELRNAIAQSADKLTAVEFVGRSILRARRIAVRKQTISSNVTAIKLRHKEPDHAK